MLNKAAALAIVVAAMWVSWLFRYDLSDEQPIVLDRWTGKVIFPVTQEHFDLGNSEER